MPRYHKTLLLPGEKVTAAEDSLSGGMTGDPHETALSDAFEVTFNDGHIMSVTVENADPPKLMVRLFATSGEEVADALAEGCVDQDYSLDRGPNTYDMTIVRAANTTLTTEAAHQYDGSRCPACGSSDLHASPPQVAQDAVRIRVECCACHAAWFNIYEFTGISSLPDDWTPPRQNVARQDS